MSCCRRGRVEVAGERRQGKAVRARPQHNIEEGQAYANP